MKMQTEESAGGREQGPVISILVAVAENGVIGRGGDLPWKLPDDLKRFKSLTLGHAIIMGRRTYQSIGRPLPGRFNIVLSRDSAFKPDGVQVASELEDAIALAEPVTGEELFIVGGSAVYQAAIPSADRLHITRVHAEVEGDVRFPPLDLSQWVLLSDDPHPADDRHALPFSFRIYERK